MYGWVKPMTRQRVKIHPELIYLKQTRNIPMKKQLAGGKVDRGLTEVTFPLPVCPEISRYLLREQGRQDCREGAMPKAGQGSRLSLRIALSLTEWFWGKWLNFSFPCFLFCITGDNVISRWLWETVELDTLWIVKHKFNVNYPWKRSFGTGSL